MIWDCAEYKRNTISFPNVWVECYNRENGKVVHFIIPRGTGLNTYANSNGDSIQKIALEFEKIAKKHLLLQVFF